MRPQTSSANQHAQATGIAGNRENAWGRRHSYAKPSSSTTTEAGRVITISPYLSRILLSGLALGGSVLYGSVLAQVSKSFKKIDATYLLWQVISTPKIFFKFHRARPHKSKAIMICIQVLFSWGDICRPLSFSCVPFTSFYTISPIKYCNIIRLRRQLHVDRGVCGHSPLGDTVIVEYTHNVNIPRLNIMSRGVFFLLFRSTGTI